MEKKEKKDNDCGCGKKRKPTEPTFLKRLMREIREKTIRK